MPQGLLEPRLYRAAFVPALLALIVLAFSVQDPPRALTPELAPPTFNAQRALATADQLVGNYGARESGSLADSRTADLVQARLSAFGFGSASYRFDATTLHGERKLVNIVGVRPGPSDRRLVIVASRDGSNGKLRRSGSIETGMLIELARVLQGRTFDHTLELASVSGGVDGGIGAEQLAAGLRRPVDGVIVLRNVGAVSDAAPVLDVFDSRLQPDPRFERTVERVAAIELSRRSGTPAVSSQLVRMGFPLALGEQANYPGAGLTVAALSPGGEPLKPPAAAPAKQVAAVGRSALRTLTTFDGSYRPAEPSVRPLHAGGKLIPAWALILFIGALLLPLVVVAVDGWARARRWHEVSTRGLIAPPAALVWLLVIGLLLRLFGLSGLIDSPSLPPDPSALHSALPIVVGFIALILATLGVLVAAAATRQATPQGGEAGFALWLVIAGVAVFIVNPVAAGFFVLLLHLLVLLLLAGTRPRRAQVWLFALIGLLPILGVLIFYPVALGLSPLAALRFGVVIESGGFIGIAALAAGCAIVAAVVTALLQLHWTAPAVRRGASNIPFERS
ncbi:MAG: hypothetical protein ACRDKI_03095 [Solirubrobacterales bacterium]